MFSSVVSVIPSHTLGLLVFTPFVAMILLILSVSEREKVEKGNDDGK